MRVTKVFGIGTLRTGTKSLGEAFKLLGYNHHSFHGRGFTEVMAGNRVPSVKHAELYDSFEDIPWFIIYKELDEAFPGSKFILTTRKSSDIWLASYTQLCLKTDSQGMHPRKRGRQNSFSLWGHETPYEDDSYNDHIRQYEEHNQKAEEYFKKKDPTRFLRVCWENGDGWEEICNFLNKPIPNIPFPHANKSKDFWKRKQ
jgi:hypothetical protein